MYYLLITALLISIGLPSNAQTTVTVGSTGVSSDVRDLGGDGNGVAPEIPADPITEALLEQIEQQPTAQFVRDENGFLVDASALAETQAQNAVEEAPEPEVRQVFRGDEARNKLEPPRTHLIYERTQY